MSSLENFRQRVLDFRNIINPEDLWSYTGRALQNYQQCSQNMKYRQEK